MYYNHAYEVDSVLNIKVHAVGLLALFSKPNVNDGEDFDGDIGESEILHNLPSTRFNIHNEDDLNKALED